MEKKFEEKKIAKDEEEEEEERCDLRRKETKGM